MKVQAASESDVDKAVAAARAAFEGDWRTVPAAERGKLLHKIADLIDRDRELLAAIDAFDNGKVCLLNFVPSVTVALVISC